MRYRPMDSDPADPRLGRFIPDDWRHVERHPLGAMPEEARPKSTPVVIGVDWFTEMFNPEQDSDGEYFVAPGGPGHAHERRGRPLRLPRARRRREERGLVGLLRPAPRGRLRRLRLVEVHVAAQQGALRAALALGPREGGRRVAGDEPR